jgi:hypothetical protein
VRATSYNQLVETHAAALVSEVERFKDLLTRACLLGADSLARTITNADAEYIYEHNQIRMRWMFYDAMVLIDITAKDFLITFDKGDHNPASERRSTTDSTEARRLVLEWTKDLRPEIWRPEPKEPPG